MRVLWLRILLALVLVRVLALVPILVLPRLRLLRRLLRRLLLLCSSATNGNTTIYTMTTNSVSRWTTTNTHTARQPLDTIMCRGNNTTCTHTDPYTPSRTTSEYQHAH